MRFSPRLRKLLRVVLWRPVHGLKRHFTRLKNKEVLTTQTEFEWPYVISTKRGLFLLTGKRLLRILNGEFYGVTLHKGEVFAFEKLLGHGRIIKFRVGGPPRASEVIGRLSGGCHQIDFIENDLYITDTYNNRILRYGSDGTRLEEYLPLGALTAGRASDNYGHINSIFASQGSIYLMCHNETSKTGRCSTVLKCTRELHVEEVIETKAQNAHNVIVIGKHIFYNDSYAYSLMRNEELVYAYDQFTRGLSITDTRVLVGGSEIAERSARKHAKGSVAVLNRDFSLAERIEIPGMVQEIRCLSGRDMSLSNSTK